MIPQAVNNWVEENGYGWIRNSKSVSGGCINNGMQITTSTAGTFFLKFNPNAPADMFKREAEGLIALDTGDALRIPKPFLYGGDFILMEDLRPDTPSKNYWENLGLRLAALHSHLNPFFGFVHSNYIGSTPQHNDWCKDGYTFFGELRLLFQARLAQKKGYLESKHVKQVENLIPRLEGLIPVQPASLIHGDLWSGNIISDPHGEPAIIDPAVHYGWAEAELAMTALFGELPQVFYGAYQEISGINRDYRLRFPIYNLYHLLNHLNLFGRGYLQSVLAILGRYSSK